MYLTLYLQNFLSTYITVLGTLKKANSNYKLIPQYKTYQHPNTSVT